MLKGSLYATRWFKKLGAELERTSTLETAWDLDGSVKGVSVGTTYTIGANVVEVRSATSAPKYGTMQRCETSTPRSTSFLLTVTLANEPSYPARERV